MVGLGSQDKEGGPWVGGASGRIALGRGTSWGVLIDCGWLSGEAKPIS